jgi:protein tyrosine phosphatase (PTP) superfamily phosphohydrolase (DUF442 family)
MLGKTTLSLIASANLAFVVGCCGTHDSISAYPPSPNAPCDRCPNGTPLPPRLGPPPSAAPSNYYTPPPFSQSQYTPPPKQGSYVPPAVRLAPPQAVAQDQPRFDQPRDTVKAPPQTVESPPASIPSDSSPLVKNETQATPPLPVDIPQFALVRPRVATGQQPFPDGVTWLQTEGYRTVLHLRPPGETDTAAQRIFEKRGLHYLSLEIGPRNLTKEVVEQFNKVVAADANQPLFVFDRDGSLAGAMWYLHYRTARGMSNDDALSEAGRLGFRKDQDDNSRTMWLAVQNYLRNQNP